MEAHRSLSAADDSPVQVATAGRHWRRFRQLLLDGLLWTLGGLGLLSVLAAIAAHVWGFSIVLFSTGSMSPTIPAGSAALVRLVPASELAVGDITTVQRPGQLPITHRITSIESVAGEPEKRVITMRGDANDSDDAEPYMVSEARVAVAAMPGVANLVSDLRDPRLLLALSLLAAVLVTWTFWPRRARQVTAIAVAAAILAAQPLAPPKAQAAESEQQVLGRHLVLTVVADQTKMASMTLGQTVLWTVGVNTRGDESGSVHMGLGLVEAVAADAISVDVLTCTQRWQQNTCAGRIETWVADRPLDAAFQPGTEPSGVREFGTTPAGTPSWIQVRATLDRDAPASATIRLRAWGSGDDVTVDSGGDTEALARTGPASPWTALWLGLASIGTGLLVTRLARVRRNAAEGAER